MTDTVLKKTPSGHYNRNQWVVMEPDAKGADDYGYTWRFLFDPSEPRHEGEFGCQTARNEAMYTHRKYLLGQIEAAIKEGLSKPCVDFMLGQELHMTYETDPTGGVYTGVTITREYDGASETLQADFAGDWEPGYFDEHIEDVMMEVAAMPPQGGDSDPLDTTAVDEPTEQLLKAALQLENRVSDAAADCIVRCMLGDLGVAYCQRIIAEIEERQQCETQLELAARVAAIVR